MNQSMRTTRQSNPVTPLYLGEGNFFGKLHQPGSGRRESAFAVSGAWGIENSIFSGASAHKREPLFDQRLEDVIDISRSILDLPDNWDDEGSPGYNLATWERATNLVRKMSYEYKRKFGCSAEPPKIYNGPQGSIDVLWKLSNRKVLINIPANENEPSDFFGSDGAGDEIQGEINHRDQSKNLGILQWLNQ
jgi:hypothetical protein